MIGDQYQHSTGVFQLKHFSPEFKRVKKVKNSRELKLFYYKKSAPFQLEPKPIGKVCGSKNFFSVKFEAFLSRKVDSPITDQALTKIITGKTFEYLSEKEKEQIRILVLSHIARTQTRRYIDSLRMSQIRQIPNKIYAKSIESKLYGITQQELDPSQDLIQKFQQLQTYTLVKYPKILESYYWTLILNQTKIPFIITDNPVINNARIYAVRKYIVQIQKTYLGYPEGFFLPLNPKIGLMLYKFTKIWYPILPIKIPINNRNFIIAINNRMVRYAWTDIMLPLNSVNLLKTIVLWDPNCLNQVNWQFKKFRIDHPRSKVITLVERKPQFKCEYCGKSFEEKFPYLNHINDPHVHLKRTVKCPNCNFKTKTQNGLNQHLRSVHKQIS